MAKFIFAFHGGGTPETEDAAKEEMQAWMIWMGEVGDAWVDPGNPVGMSKTVMHDKVEDHGGSNPLSGYSIVEADSIEAACDIAKGCPILKGTPGTIEVAPIIEM